jgi:flagellar biosynthesis chaperone FliJ
MPVTTEKFDQLKVEKLKHFLEDMAAKGSPRPYEIFVDNLKVVPKTEEAKDFDNYEYYVNENTEKLRILIYNSAASPRNDQYCFLLQNNQVHKSVNGLGEIDSIIQEKIAAREREIEMGQLRSENEDLKKQLEESEEYAEQLQSQIEDQKKNKFKLGNINLGELASVAVEGMIRRNPQLLTKIPGGEALAGIIEQDNLEKENKQLPEEKETQASFQKVAPNTTATEEQQRYIMFLQQLEVALTEEQMQATLQILNQFVQHPDKISIVADLLNK